MDGLMAKLTLKVILRCELGSERKCIEFLKYALLIFTFFY